MLDICSFPRELILICSIEQIVVLFAAGAFHLIHMMFDEYVFLVMETQHDQVTDKTLQKAVQKYMKCAGMYRDNKFSINCIPNVVHIHVLQDVTKCFNTFHVINFFFVKKKCNYSSSSSYTTIRRIIILNCNTCINIIQRRLRPKLKCECPHPSI